MNKYIIDTKPIEELTAASKAREDIIQILSQHGYEPCIIPIKRALNYYELFVGIKDVYKKFIRILEDLPKNSDIIIQYPWDSMTHKFAKYFSEYKKKTDSSMTVIIHDLNGLRTQKRLGKFYFEHVVKEAKYLDSFDWIICHNESMKKWLTDNEINTNKVIPLNLFDYLADKNYDIKNKTTDFNIVNIAGNLAPDKAIYLNNIDSLKNNIYTFNLYGINYSNTLDKEFVNYKGAFQPEQLLEKINSGFGLVWDGSSLDSCNGFMGKYLQINNPHKLSLYMTCGIPVIVWNQAAVAKFVIENKVGFTIDSLYDIEEKLKSMSADDYLKLQNNAIDIGKRALKGNFLLEALGKRNL